MNIRLLQRFLIACFMFAVYFSNAHTATAAPRVLPEGKLPNDRRLGPQKDLNGYFPFDVPATREAWEHRAAELRRRVLVATGLWPMPEKTPLHAVIHGRVERDGFTVEKVFFESYPGHFVTGLLFRPENKSGRGPAVLCPHGHGGRLQDYGAANMAKLIESGAEKHEASGRYPKLARCAQLARMGCVVFIFDMLGYADSVQIPSSLAHGFSKQRPEFDTKESWGLFSTQAELRMQSIMGIQTWNSVRALDLLCSLPDVDPQRVGVTGGSGGGTQTILLGAIDPRPIVAFPQGMVSTAMQGGCTCENCNLLRVGTGNVELAALFAPRPQGMTAANDWTKEMMTKGFPQLQQLYGMLGVKDNVMCEPQLHFPHNYNYVTRALMYHWFNRHLKLGLDEPIVEQDFKPLTPEEWTVWNDEHPAPKGGEEYERSLCKYIDEQSHRQIAALAPTNKKSLAEFREIVGGAFETIIGGGLPAASQIEREKIDKQDRGDFLQFADLIRNQATGSELPVVSFFPTKKDWNKQVVIWIDGRGKSAMFGEDGQPIEPIRRLLDAGTSVLGADLLYQGEFLADGKPLTEAPVVANPRQAACYKFCYNHTLVAQRAHDILTLIAFARGYENQPSSVDLVGLHGAGPWAAAARAVSGDASDRCAIDTGGFRFVDLKSYRDVNFLPGAVKYGDLPGLLALSAPHKLWLAGEGGKIPDIASASYRASGSGADVVSFKGTQDGLNSAIVQWLLGR